MEENKKTIWIVLGLGVVGLYLFMKNKANAAVTKPKPATPGTGTGTRTDVDVKPAPTATENPIILPTTDGTTNKYPIALVFTPSEQGRQATGEKVRLKDGDAVKGTPEMVYVLKDGEKHWASGTWWFYNFGQDWSNVINIQDETLSVIPTGKPFTINGL